MQISLSIADQLAALASLVLVMEIYGRRKTLLKPYRHPLLISFEVAERLRRAVACSDVSNTKLLRLNFFAFAVGALKYTKAACGVLLPRSIMP